MSLTNQLAGYWTDDAIIANLLVIMHMAGALFLGLVVGYERSYRGRAAGMRTYGLVCMAACALTVYSGYWQIWYDGNGRTVVTDPARVMQGIVTGVGFLCAGVIMRDGLNISGLTTAASIWAVAAVGILVGTGFFIAATALAFMCTALMMWGSKIDAMLPARHAVAITVVFKKTFIPNDGDLRKLITASGYSIAKGSFTIARHADHHEWRFVVVSHGKKKGGSLSSLSHVLSDADGIESFHLLHARN